MIEMSVLCGSGDLSVMIDSPEVESAKQRAIKEFDLSLLLGCDSGG